MDDSSSLTVKRNKSKPVAHRTNINVHFCAHQLFDKIALQEQEEDLKEEDELKLLSNEPVLDDDDDETKVWISDNRDRSESLMSVATSSSSWNEDVYEKPSLVMAQVKKRCRLMGRRELEKFPELIQRIQLLLPSKDAARTCILSKSWLHAWSTKSWLMGRRELEKFPELIHRIQLLLPSKDAARTCILSKSWLHAWSTIPAIRFSPSVDTLRKKQHQRKHMTWIHRTLLPYRRDNLPITSLDLQFGIHTAFRSAYKLIMEAAASKSNELHLAILPAASFTLPDEIFSSDNLHTLSLTLINLSVWKNFRYSLHISSNPPIHCTNLRVLKLDDVHISQEVLHKLLSTCKLLEKIDIKLPLELRTIKVNNLRYLYELRINNPSESDDILEVTNVPSLRSLAYETFFSSILWFKPVLYKMGTIGSLRELYLDNVSMDDEFLSMLNSNFPFLESLTLIIKWCSVEILDIRCLTLLRLKLRFDPDEQIKVQLYAPNLLVYTHKSTTMPSLLFPTVPPQQIDLCLRLNNLIDELFFLKMREALEVSSKFIIEIWGSEDGVLVPFNIDDVRTILPFPATSVEQLVFATEYNRVLWENSLFFDAVFSICHPMYVKANSELSLKVAKYLLNQLMVKENEKGKVMYCEIRNPLDGRWEALTSSSLSLLPHDCSDVFKLSEFKLSWCSP